MSFFGNHAQQQSLCLPHRCMFVTTHVHVSTLICGSTKTSHKGFTPLKHLSCMLLCSYSATESALPTKSLYSAAQNMQRQELITAWCRRVVRIPADAIAGTKHVIGIVPLNVDSEDAKDNTDSLLLRLPDQEQVSPPNPPITGHPIAA